MSHKSSMHDSGESYSGIVPTKQPNKSGTPPAEAVEGRPLTKENTSEPNSCRTPCRESGRSGLERVREAARKEGFTHICGTNHKTGKFTVHRRTIGKRMAARLKELRVKLRQRMHASPKTTGERLVQVVRGYFQYHAVPGNGGAGLRKAGGAVDDGA